MADSYRLLSQAQTAWFVLVVQLYNMEEQEIDDPVMPQHTFIHAGIYTVTIHFVERKAILMVRLVIVIRLLGA